MTLCKTTHIVCELLLHNITNLQTHANKKSMEAQTGLKKQVDFWGGINLAEVAKELGYSDTYVYMCVSGRRQNPKVSSLVMQRLEKRKKDLRRALNGDERSSHRNQTVTRIH